MCKKLIFLTFLAVFFVLGQGQARGAYFAAYWDADYPSEWTTEDEVSTAVRDGLVDAGYDVLDAAQLKTFMDARIADGAASVVVLCKDNAPDTVVETNTADCTLRKYLDAGGRVVMYADIPFWNQGNAGNIQTNWGQSGANGILGFSASPNSGNATWDAGDTVTITDEVLEWGLTGTWSSIRPANPDDVDVVLATDNDGGASAWVKFFADDETGRFIYLWDYNMTSSSSLNIDDIIAVAGYALGGGGNPFARLPDPQDGSLLEQTWGTLSWKAGYYAVSHDLYMGTNFEDVNDGTADTFIGNLPTTTQIIGFTGFPFPDGLVPGTTYHWRVDEVNDANAASPWKGDVWSFSVPPRTGYRPIPADGAKFVETDDVALSWTPGFGARLHHVYFGESFDEVDAAVGALPQATATFTVAAPLDPEKVYYWRVDEFDAATTHKGPVWSFTTAREGGGIKGEYFNNENL
ncbi:MAG: hypothetical protein JSW59_09035, partial [Phycisphaerales bacterium]